MSLLFVFLALIAPKTQADDIGELINNSFEAVGTVESNAELKTSLENYATTLKELDCITKLVPGMEKPQAQNNIRAIWPHLEKYFKEKNSPPMERMAFYSQAVMESWQFNHFSSIHGAPGVGGNENMDSQQADLVALINGSTKEQAVAGEQFGEKANYFGRGPIQLVGCYNYIAALHSLNVKSNGLGGKQWETNWKGKRADGSEYDIGTSCTYEDIDNVNRKYREEYDFPLDPYGVLKNPINLLLLSGTLEFPGAQPGIGMPKSMKGSQLLIDMNMAFWDGKCGGLRPIAKSKNVNADLCPTRSGETETRYISRCYSECIKGADMCRKPEHTPTCKSRREYLEKFIASGCVK